MNTNTLQNRDNTVDAPSATEDLRWRLASPAVDILEGDDAFLLIADMPGLDPQGIDIRLERETLYVEAPSNVDGLEPVLYKRTFRVLRGLDPEAIGATYKNGVLSVRLPKPDAIRPRKITVAAG